MSNVYSLMGKELEDFIRRVYPHIPQITLDADSGYGEFTAPLGYISGMSISKCVGDLCAAVIKSPPMFMGKKLIQRITASEGHVCFHLTVDAYSAALDHIIREYPIPPIPEDTSSRVDYAVARMIMLCRGERAGCPDKAKIKQAVWLSLGIEGTKGKKREAMRKRAAEALCTMFDGLTPEEHNTFRTKSASVGGACARLLALETEEN